MHTFQRSQHPMEDVDSVRWIMNRGKSGDPLDDIAMAIVSSKQHEAA